MANLETAQGQNIFQFTLPVMVAGVQTYAGVVANVLSNNYFLGTSKILGFIRTTSGGTVGTPAIESVTISGAVGSRNVAMTVKSTDVLDTSVYTLVWVNEIANNSAQLNA